MAFMPIVGQGGWGEDEAEIDYSIFAKIVPYRVPPDDAIVAFAIDVSRTARQLPG